MTTRPITPELIEAAIAEIELRQLHVRAALMRPSIEKALELAHLVASLPPWAREYLHESHEGMAPASIAGPSVRYPRWLMLPSGVVISLEGRNKPLRNEAQRACDLALHISLRWTRLVALVLLVLCGGVARADNACYAACYAIAKPCFNRAECNAKSNGCYDRCDKAPPPPPPPPAGPPPLVASVRTSR